MLKISALRLVYLLIQNRRMCSREYHGLPIDPRTDGMTYAEGRARWNYYTDKCIALLDAARRTRGDMQLIWGRHASELLDKRDKYRAWKPQCPR